MPTRLNKDIRRSVHNMLHMPNNFKPNSAVLPYTVIILKLGCIFYNFSSKDFLSPHKIHAFPVFCFIAHRDKDIKRYLSCSLQQLRH